MLVFQLFFFLAVGLAFFRLTGFGSHDCFELNISLCFQRDGCNVVTSLCFDFQSEKTKVVDLMLKVAEVPVLC